VLDTLIFENVATAESPNHKQDIFSFNAQSVGAANYMTLLDELIAQNLVNTQNLISATNPVNAESTQSINTLSQH
jgi:hypothetical protein